MAVPLTVAHRQAQLALRAGTIRDLLVLWPLLDVNALDKSFPGWAQIVGALVARDHARSSGLSAAYLRAFKAGQGISTPPVIKLAQAPPAEQVLTRLLVTGPVMIKKSMTVGKSIAQASQDAFVTSSGAATDLALDGGRTTVLECVEADPQARGWMRTGSAKSCSFCRMLIDRGTVYGEDKAHFASHAHCSCGAEPQYDPSQSRPVDEEFIPSQRRLDQSTRDANNARAREFITNAG